jgi:hypothetical protein
MRSLWSELLLAAGALTVLLPATAGAQPPRRIKPSVHQMEIYNGTHHRVRYFGINVSPGESASLRDLERAENEAIYVTNLQALKQQYAADEREMEARRLMVQKKLYGTSITSTFYGGVGGAYPTWGTSGYPLNTLFPYPYRGDFGYPAFGYGAGLAGYGGGGSTTVTRSLAFGQGDEGRIKDAMAQVLANQATPDYAASVDRALDRAVVRAASSPAIRLALGLPDRSRNPLAFAAAESAPVTITLKSGETLTGTKMESTKEWMILTTADGRKVYVRPSEVTRFEEGKSGSIKFAAD